MKTKDQLLRPALISETGFKSAVVELLADIRKSIITAILLDRAKNVTGIIHSDLYDKALIEMKRVITEEAKDK